MAKLQDFVSKKSIALQVEVTTWKEAVRAAGDLLEAQSICISGYVDAMIQAIEHYGPYMVIAPGVALVHSRPGKSICKTGVSLINLATPVNFGDVNNDPVSLVIAFAADDDGTHIDMLRQMAMLLIDEKNLQVLMTAKKKKDVLSVIAGVDEE